MEPAFENGMNTAENKTSPSFAPRFLLAVALFLLFTAGVKLCSVLLETKVLGASDPLLPLFTERQVIFAAAVLELWVAYALFRNRHAIWAPWLVLWLVGVFAAYRLGLWAIGFHGHCSCLGHLFEWLPGFNEWADRLMLVFLAIMSTGSLWALRVRLVQTSLRSQAPTPGKATLVWFFCSGLTSIVVARSDQGAHPLTVSPFEVRGNVHEYSLYGSSNHIIRHFVCRTDGNRWSIDMAVTSDLAPKPIRFGTNTFLFKLAADSECAASDGTNFYVVHKADVSGQSQNDRTHQASTITASAKIGPGYVPFGEDETLLVIWYSFASAPYFAERNASTILAPHSIIFDDVKLTNHFVSARWTLFSELPQLPNLIITSNYFYSDSVADDLVKSSFPHTNLLFQVLESTQHLGLKIPTRVSADYFFHRREHGIVKQLASKRVELVATEILDLAGNIVVRPPLRESAVVYDMRFWFSNPPVQVAVQATNGWPSEDALRAKYLARVEWEGRHTMRPFIMAVFIVFGFGPPLALWWIIRNKRRGTQFEEV